MSSSGPGGRRRGRRAWVVVGQALAVVSLVLVLVLSSVGLSEATALAPRATKLQQFDRHISHIIFLMQENRAFDNFFGVYCPTIGTYCPETANGVPPGTCVPLYPGTSNTVCHRPFNLTLAAYSTTDLAHDWWSTHIAYNYGQMNDFFQAEGTNRTFGHFNGSTLPVYWDVAEQYGLADDFFSSAMSYSLPNHWYMLGASAPAASFLQFPPWAGRTVQRHYLAQANATPTIEDQLVNSTLPWKYYDFSLQNYSVAIHNSACCGGGSAFDLWNPLAARHASYAAQVASHFVNRGQFFTDAANGRLPSVSWIIPTDWQSDHSPANLSDGQNWSASVIDALEASPEWNSTVLFISWDEYGGWYDHVAPPVRDGVGDSFRVPLVAIGPWVQQGVIDHTPMDFGSILHLMEVRFGFQCIGPRDCLAKLPLGMFDFTHGPRAPILIPAYGQAFYPMPLQSSGRLPALDPQAAPPLATDPPPGELAFLGGDPD